MGGGNFIKDVCAKRIICIFVEQMDLNAISFGHVGIK